MFSNGEKLNPLTIEETLSQHPAIKGAIVAGQGEFQPVLILEPEGILAGDSKREELIDQVWPLVEQVNETTVAHGRILRQFIIVLDGDKQFQRSPKGAIQRGQTLKMFQDHISLFYKKFKDAAESQDAVDLDLSSQAALAQCITEMVARTNNSPVAVDTDLFQAGIDSLQAIHISRLLRGSLKRMELSHYADVVAPSAIYANPTANLLAAHILAAGPVTGEKLADASQHLRDREMRELQVLVAKYTLDLPQPNTQQHDPPENQLTVLLTGSTGSLGAYLLDALCRNPRVKRVVALNRGPDGGEARQPFVSSDRGLSTDFSKVDFLCVDISESHFALAQEVYHKLLATADRIIHNAWPVNFNLSISSFEPSIRGVRRLADFANAARKRVPIVYISSIGAVQEWSASDPVPEERLDDISLAEMGYGRSKLAGSLILDAAVEHSGILAASIRVGQIAGSRRGQGIWNKQEFLPSLIASSVHLGALPGSLGTQDIVDWCAVEDIANLILDVAAINTTFPVLQVTGYFHGVSPETATWPTMATIIRDYYGERIGDIVSFEEWLDMLEDSITRTGETDLDKNPAVKLIDTYRDMLHRSKTGHKQVRLSTERTKSYSPTMTRLEAIDSGLMTNWCRQWNF